MARLMFIDDDRLTLQLMQKMADILGHEAVLSQNTGEAWLRLQEERPDVVLVDLRMDGISGITFIQNVRRSQTRARTIPMFVLSADRNAKDEDAAMQAGATGYLCKPISLAELSSIADNKKREYGSKNH